MPNSFQQTLAHLTHKEKKQWCSLTALSLLTSVADIASLALLLYVVHFYTSAIVQPPAYIKAAWLFNKHSITLIALFFIGFTIKNWLAYQVTVLQNRYIYNVASRLSCKNLHHYLQGNFSNYIQTDSAVLTRKISLQPLEFAQQVLYSWQQVFTEAVLILLTITAILLFNAQLFLLLLIILLPPVLLAGWFTKRTLATARNYIKHSRLTMWQHLHESINGYVESNVFGKNDFFTRRYANAQSRLNRHQSHLQSVQALPARLTEVFAVFGLLALIGLNQVAHHLPLAGELVIWGAFVVAAYKIIPGASRLSNSLGQLRTYAFITQEMKPPTAIPKVAAAPLPAIRSIAFENISFHYHQTTLLHQFSCTLQQGDFVGIQGQSGKGKTTLLNMLLGFTAPQAGHILINDTITSKEERQQYWPQIAYVKQQPFLMHDTLLANITLNGEQYNQELLEEVITTTGIKHWQQQEPATALLTENGRNISGGQRQRVALARALYKNANVLILDEPFSELDEQAEQTLLLHLQQLAATGKLVILITHNPQSFAYCNKLIQV